MQLTRAFLFAILTRQRQGVTTVWYEFRDC
jgi:hypothetical protein